MNILLLGCMGHVGWELQRALSPLGEVVALDLSPTSAADCVDLSDAQSLSRTVRHIAPDVIVNAAAYTAVDQAESQSALAHAVNALAPAVLAAEAQRLGAWLLHFSSDYVFDGSGQLPWRETDAPAPLNVYGHSKHAGDVAVAQYPKHLILRSSWVYGLRGNNFPKTILRLAAEQDSLRVVADQWGAPTSAELLADVTAHVLRIAMAAPELAGLYHCAAAGAVSWQGYASFVLAQAQALGWALRAGPGEVLATATVPEAGRALRPLNSRLNTDKLQQAFGLHLPSWQDGVLRFLAELKEVRS